MNWVEKVQRFLSDHHVGDLLRTSSERFPLFLRDKSAQEGLMLVDVPQSEGGYGVPNEILGAIYFELGRVNVNARELVGAGHGRTIYDWGSEYQKQIFRPRMEKGKLFIGVGLTELECGSDLSSIQTTATKVLNGYLLEGTKAYVSRVEEADVFIVFAKTDDKLTAFLVDMNQDTIQRFQFCPMGLKGWSYGGFHLQNVFVPDEFMLGEIGQGFQIFQHHFSSWRVFMTLLCLGAAHTSLKETIEYAKQRNAFGGPIARFQSVMHRVAEDSTKLEASLLLCYRALQNIDRGKTCNKEVAMAKWYGTQVAYETIDHMIQIHGARGYINELPLEQRLRDTRGFLIADGSSDVLKSAIGKELFGHEIYQLMLSGKNKNGR